MERMKSLGHEYANKVKDTLTEVGRERLLLEINLDLPIGFDEIVKETMAPPTDDEEENAVSAVVLVSHKAHPAGLAGVKAANRIIKTANKVLPESQKLTGSLLIMASTMEHGQSGDVVEGLKSVQPIFDKHHVESLFVLREKDVTENIKEYPEKEESIRKTWAKNRGTQRSVLGNVVEKGQIPILLPEGTVQSGRQKIGGEPGEINGMVDLQPNSVTYLATLLRRQKRDPLLFFVGSTGENEIYDPITERVTEDAKRIGRLKAIPLIHTFVHSPMSAVMDYPTRYSDIVAAFGNNGVLERGILEQYCGERLAQLIPYGRGVYTEPKLLDKAPEIQRRDTTTLF